MLGRLLLIAVLALAACSSKKSAGAGSGSSETPPVAGSGSGSGSAPALDAAGILAKLQSFRDVACACTDAPCVQTNERAMRNWLLREGPATMALKPTPAEMAAADKVTAEMSACVEKILNPAPPPPPAAP